MSATNLYPSSPSEPFTNVEERLEEQTNDINGFQNSFKNPKGMITYFKDENRQSKKKFKFIMYYLLNQKQLILLL